MAYTKLQEIRRITADLRSANARLANTLEKGSNLARSTKSFPYPKPARGFLVATINLLKVVLLLNKKAALAIKARQEVIRLEKQMEKVAKKAIKSAKKKSVQV
jgi:hypothetical protein